MRLFLVGQDEALDIVAELSRHLDYFEVSRLDELPKEPFGPEDHVVLGARYRSLSSPGLQVRSTAGLMVVLSSAQDETPGAAAIDAASELVRARRNRQRS